ATLGITCSQWYNLSHAFGERDYSSQEFSGLPDLLVRANTLWLPLNWAGRGLVDIGEGRWLSGIALLFLTIGLCALAFWFSLATAERWYYSGWAGMQTVTRKKKPVRAAPHRANASTALGAGLPSWANRLVPAPVRAVVGKDFLVLRRDLKNLSQLITPLILGVMYTLMIFQTGGDPPPGQGEAPTWFMDLFRMALAFGNVGMSLFVGWMLLSRLAGVSFSMEGKNYWVLKAAPLRAVDLLFAKFLVAYLPTLALGTAFLVVISIVQGISFGVFLYSLVVFILSLAGMTGLLLGSGAAGANLEWDDPRKMNAGILGCLGQFITMLYLPVALALFIGPLGLAVALQVSPVYGYLAGLAFGGVFALGLAIIPPLLARKKVERLGE
ncbi:MAG: hypothetical protein AB1750_16020, partial [Chloroflexota bacterium]